MIDYWCSTHLEHETLSATATHPVFNGGESWRVESGQTSTHLPHAGFLQCTYKLSVDRLVIAVDKLLRPSRPWFIKGNTRIQETASLFLHTLTNVIMWIKFKIEIAETSVKFIICI